MKLFERVALVATDITGSRVALGTALGLSQSKFRQYLNPTSEKNLWQHLPRILELYPQVSRNWLYFGEGEMLGRDATEQGIAQPTQQATPHPAQADAPRIRELEQQVMALQKELLGTQTALIDAKTELVTLYKERAEGREGVQTVHAPTQATAAHLLP